MLVLKRHRGEVITIGDAYVQVLQISEEWVELGVTAPPEWAITREFAIDSGSSHRRTDPDTGLSDLRP